MIKNGARLLKDIISSCDGKGCYPIHMFSAEEIEEAIEESHSRGTYTNNYRGDYIDYTNNYRGRYQDRPIFIKRHLTQSGEEDAFNEIVLLSQIDHGNVVKLLGCCLETEYPILIYELLPHCLYNLLHVANPSGPISWENRLKIAVEIAYAITYLHLGKPRPIVHRDINIRNILLDEHYRPKLSGLKFSVTIPLGETHVKTDLIYGGYGYMDPHYAAKGIVSEKTDVYSFGMLLLELLSGKKPMELVEIMGNANESPPWGNGSLMSEKDEIIQLILDNGVSMDTRQVEQSMACLEIALKCSDLNQDQRPSMKDVTQQLRQIERAELTLPSSSTSLLIGRTTA